MIDHVTIYLLIAGTYTPFTLGVLRGVWGWTLFGMVWSLAAAGIVFKTSLGFRYPRGSTVFYLLMGWVAVGAIRPITAQMPAAGFALARRRRAPLHPRGRLLRVGAATSQPRDLAPLRAGRQRLHFFAVLLYGADDLLNPYLVIVLAALLVDHALRILSGEPDGPGDRMAPSPPTCPQAVAQ